MYCTVCMCWSSNLVSFDLAQILPSYEASLSTRTCPPPADPPLPHADSISTDAHHNRGRDRPVLQAPKLPSTMTHPAAIPGRLSPFSFGLTEWSMQQLLPAPAASN